MTFSSRPDPNDRRRPGRDLDRDPLAEASRDRIRLAGHGKQVIDLGRSRLLGAAAVFLIAFGAIAVRLVDLTVMDSAAEPRRAEAPVAAPVVAGRADILDRNGVILATTLRTWELVARPHLLRQAKVDARKAAERLASALGVTDVEGLFGKLTSDKRFVYVDRFITPKKRHAVNALGIAGLEFHRSSRRVYPQGPLASHILGLTDVDGRGTAGMELSFNDRLSQGVEALHLSIDIRLQMILHEELVDQMAKFSAIGATGLVMDALNGEILAMVSLPDFDPNDPATAQGEAAFNRATLGVYEMGSTFKLFTAAMALDTGTVRLTDGYDASEPLKVARFSISDYHGQNRWLSVPEIIVHSSNIGTAKMMLDVGIEAQKDYLGRLGLLEPAKVELPETGEPLLPRRWREVNAITISYGHGISVSPVHVATAVSALVNGGMRVKPTLLPALKDEGRRVLRPETSAALRDLMRLVATRGTGRNADRAAPGYHVGGKTGTADKLDKGRYARDKRISSFVGAFPMDKPRYVVLAVFDEPKGIKESLNYATGGWVAAPAVGRVVNRMGPLLGLAPDFGAEPGLEALWPKDAKRPAFGRPIAEPTAKKAIDAKVETAPPVAQAGPTFSADLVRTALDEARRRADPQR
ncbi:MAG: peptidoglycan D,D-transpeptidase FtsI family protein [Rhodospirillales bacterium]